MVHEAGDHTGFCSITQPGVSFPLDGMQIHLRLILLLILLLIHTRGEILAMKVWCLVQGHVGNVMLMLVQC
jgi:hypothetical protein